MRCFVMFVTAVCLLFLLKLKWPKNNSFYDSVYQDICRKAKLQLRTERIAKEISFNQLVLL